MPVSGDEAELLISGVNLASDPDFSTKNLW